MKSPTPAPRPAQNRQIGAAAIFATEPKRLQKNNILKTQHTVRSSGPKQIEALITDAKTHGLMPVYCFYASEDQRKIRQVTNAPDRTSPFEFGCLLASAHHVKAKDPWSLGAIEADCVPWHYLVDRRRLRRLDGLRLSNDRALGFLIHIGDMIQLPVAETGLVDLKPVGDFPTIDELNNLDAAVPIREGMFEHRGDDVGLEVTASAF